MTNPRSQLAFSLAELVVAIAVAGIIILLSTKVYLILFPQFRKSYEVSESQFKALLKVSSLEKRITKELQPRNSIGIKGLYNWLESSSDSLDVSWTLNQYARDSVYSINQDLLEKHYESLLRYEQDYLYFRSLAITIYDDRDKRYFIFSDHPNFHRIKVKELFQ